MRSLIAVGGLLLVTVGLLVAQQVYINVVTRQGSSCLGSEEVHLYSGLAGQHQVEVTIRNNVNNQADKRTFGISKGQDLFIGRHADGSKTFTYTLTSVK